MEMNLKKISSITLFTSFALGRARTRYFLRTTISPFNPSLKILISLYSILILYYLFIFSIYTSYRFSQYILLFNPGSLVLKRIFRTL